MKGQLIIEKPTMLIALQRYLDAEMTGSSIVSDLTVYECGSGSTYTLTLITPQEQFKQKLKNGEDE